MLDLETSISEWRGQVITESNLSADIVDELESHLREEIEQLVRSGLPEETAFERALVRFGSASNLTAEFQKLETITWWPIKVATAVEFLAFIIVPILLIAHYDPDRLGWLLASHIFAVTLGYSTTFLIGALGICFVSQRCVSDFPVRRMRAIVRATSLLSCVALVLTATAIILGMLWAKAEWGRYWAWDIKETGGFAVFTWQALFLLAHRLKSFPASGILIMSLVGNIVVTVAWFGSNLLTATHNYGALGWSLLLIGVLLNGAFFLAGLPPAGWLRSRKTA